MSARKGSSIAGCKRLGLARSISIFDPSFLRFALAFHRAGTLAPGTIIKLYCGGERMPFGLPPSVPSLDACLAMLEVTDLPWLVAVLGGDVTASGLAQKALDRGGHVRVGLEDYAGERTPRNRELVAELVELIDRSDRRLAGPATSRKVFGMAL